MKRVAIVGAGITGTTLAWHLVKAGCQVDIFENGPEVPYPHAPQFEAEVLYANQYAPPTPSFPPPLPPDIKNISQAGDYGGDLQQERIMCVGGQATRWFAMTPRIGTEHFRSFSLYGFGRDWPISYEDLEPYYSRAEAHIGVSGQSDNPFAPRRASPFPLPAFALSYQDRIFAEKLKARGIVTHTTPQARAREDYDGRPGCQNFGECERCPVGARYSPNHHLEMLRDSKLFALHANCLVRRIIVEKGRAIGIAYHPDHGARQIAHHADVVIVAAGAIETARLLLLSKGPGIHSDGLGNASGQVGRNFGMHHVWWNELSFAKPVMPGRAGPPTLLSHQFTLPEKDGGGGGMTVEMFDGVPQGTVLAAGRRQYVSGKASLEALRPFISKRALTVNAETIPSDDKYVALGDKRDRFGDPFAAVTYKLNDFDRATYQRAQRLAGRFGAALGAESLSPGPIEQFWSAHHHLGTCRMGDSLHDSVTDSFGALHETSGVYICGGAAFPTVTPLQPTLTMVALAIRSADRIAEQLAG